ncbi:HIRAN domain-containing protein [Chloroflexota bacterium]
MNNRNNHQVCSSTSLLHSPDSKIETTVVGVTFEGRQAVVAKLQVCEEILCRREPANPYDDNAIKVERLDGDQIGYINRFLAADLAPIFDAHGRPVTGTVTRITGSLFAGCRLGVWIIFTMP